MSSQTEKLEKLAEAIRKSSFETIYNSGSGHLGACSSSAELLTTLYFGGLMRYDSSNPSDSGRDRVYIRGHVGPLRYKIFSLLGWINESELSGYRKIGSRLKGHESMHHMPGVDMSPSGSLGMLLSYATGAAISTRYQGLSSRHIVFLGDGEEQEGNVSEAARHIASLNLDNIVCILDRNQKQLSRPTVDVDGMSDINKIWEGYGWQVREIKNGHNISEILDAYTWAFSRRSPAFLVANTIKGKGLEGCLEHDSGYHTIGACKDKSVVLNAFSSEENSNDSIKREGLLDGLTTREPTPPLRQIFVQNKEYPIRVNFTENTSLSFDSAQIEYLVAFSELNRGLKIPFYFLTPDLIRRDIVRDYKLDEGSRYFDVGIREQHAIALAHSISQTEPNSRILLNCFDAFLLRSSDQLNAAAQGQSRLILLSDVSGLTQGTNGASHQSSCQPSVPLMMPNVDFFEPGDVKDMYNVLNYSMSKNPGIVYIRLPKIKVKTLPRLSDHNRIDYYPVKDHENPDITLIGSSFVTGNLLEAANRLEAEGIKSRLINVVSPKRLDREFADMIQNNKPVLVAYNGNPSVLQSAVSEAVLRFQTSRPKFIVGHGFMEGDTGSVDDLLRFYKLDSSGLEGIIRGVLNG